MPRTRTAAVLLAALALSQPVAASDPAMDAFTYQGELRLNGQPVLGPVNLAFRLYDAAQGGVQIGPEIEALSL